MRNAFLAATPLAVVEIPAPAGNLVILRGYLVDQMCADSIAEQGRKAAAEHDRTCALIEVGVASSWTDCGG